MRSTLLANDQRPWLAANDPAASFNPASNRSRIIPRGSLLRRGTYLNPQAFRFEAGHLGRSRPHRLLPAVQQLRHSCFVDDRRGDWDAGEAGTEHATIATSIATSP